MAVADTIRFVLGIIGNIISLILFLVPIATFYKIVKWRSTRRFSAAPYLAAFTNCILWVFYGLPFVHPNSILVVTVNGAGTVLETIYIIVFLIFCRTVKQRMQIFGVLAVVFVCYAVVIVCTLLLAHTHDKRSYIVGVLCTVFNICMYASPLSVIRRVVRTKSVKYLPVYLCFAGFLNGICWTAYGCIDFDVFIVVPNGLGIFFGATQLLLYGVYYRSTKWDAEDSQAEDEPDDARDTEMGSQPNKLTPAASDTDNTKSKA